MSSSTETPISLSTDILQPINRIMKSHSLHFHVLSLLFLFPIFFTLVVYPSFHLALFHPHHNFITFTQLSTSEIIVTLAYCSFLALFFLFAIATITYSALQVSYDRPINLVSSVKSITNSFFPLLSTFIISHTVFVSVFLAFILVFYFFIQILQSLGLRLDVNENYFWFLIILVPVLVWLQVKWSLAYVIAVVESKYGFEALRRSAYLVKGKRRWVALSMMLIYGLVMGMLVGFGSMYLVIVDAAKANKWRSLGVILQTAECSVLGFLMMNQYLVANVALYMYSKDFNGEKLPLEIGDKFPGEYLSMPLNDEKDKHGIV